MKKLNKILQILQINTDLIELINQKITIPYLDDFNFTKDYWYPHPPCLIPIFLGYGASYKGVLKHFFIDRNKTFIEYELEWGHFLEFARNEKQIFSQMILDMIMVTEELNDKIATFCQNVHFEKCKEVDSFSDEYGNILEDYDKLEFLNEETPLDYIHNLEDYKGDFPSSSKLFNKAVINKSCSFEIAKDDYLKEVENLPEWLKENSNQKEFFYKYLDTNELDKAWLTLNSTGWKLKDVADGLEVLKTKTTDELFHLVANNWIEGMRQAKREEEVY